MTKLRIFLVLAAAAVIGWTWGSLAPYDQAEVEALAAEQVAEAKAAILEENLNCYGFVLGSPIPLIPGMSFSVNSSVGNGVSAEELFSVVSSAINEWEAYSSDIFSGGYVDEYATFVYGDGLNTITFGELADSQFANTSIRVQSDGGGNWQIAEWDIVLSTSYSYSWGDELQEDGVADLQGILTHELGHALGLSDLANQFCSDQTMYYGSEVGNISKLRDLGEQDLEGLRLLYQNN